MQLDPFVGDEDRPPRRDRHRAITALERALAAVAVVVAFLVDERAWLLPIDEEEVVLCLHVQDVQHMQQLRHEDADDERGERHQAEMDAALGDRHQKMQVRLCSKVRAACGSSRWQRQPRGAWLEQTTAAKGVGVGSGARGASVAVGKLGDLALEHDHPPE